MLTSSIAYIIMHFRLDFIIEANTMNPDQTAPLGSSLIWVHSVCNVGYESTQTDERSRERSGLVVECLTKDRGAAGSSLTSVTALCP